MLLLLGSVFGGGGEGRARNALGPARGESAVVGDRDDGHLEYVLADADTVDARVPGLGVVHDQVVLRAADH